MFKKNIQAKAQWIGISALTILILFSIIAACTLEPEISKLKEEAEGPAIKSKTLTSIEITVQPTKTSYTAGETLDLTGLEVKANYSDKSSKTVTPTSTTPADGAVLSITHTKVTVSYKEGNITRTDEFNITVNAASS